MNDEKSFLQYSLKTEMSETVVDIEKVIFVTLTENIRSQIQRLSYWTEENSWMNVVSKSCSYVQVFNA